VGKVCDHIEQIHGAVIGSMPPDQGYVLEVGCGQGRLLRRLAGLRPSLLVGIDRRVCPNRESPTPIHFIMADMRWLPFKSSTFHACLCVNVVSELSRDELTSGIWELFRVINSTGRVYITFQNLYNPPLLLRTIWRRFVLGHRLGSIPSIRYMLRLIKKSKGDLYRLIPVQLTPVRSFTGFLSHPLIMPVQLVIGLKGK
jgi:ubiquinone/menaquinone biosynthesis C-methylase UbiE